MCLVRGDDEEGEELEFDPLLCSYYEDQDVVALEEVGATMANRLRPKIA